MSISTTKMCVQSLVLVALFHSTLLSKLFATSSSSYEAPIKHTLLTPLTIQDGKLVACSRKNLFAFERNGSVAWVVPLGLFCREDVAPVTDDRGKIYLVAENTVLKINPSKIGSTQPPSKALFSYNSSEEIMGLSISPGYLSLFITIRNRGLLSFLLRGELQWSIAPVLHRHGYTQGCRNDSLNCYFDSAPVVDLCEGTIYVTNTEGQVYSVYIRYPQYKWIQDLGTFGDKMIITPGNNGFVYATFPNKAVVVCLDVETGNITWQQTVGPLSSQMASPMVDSNGWISIGSVDGILYSISPNGDVKKLLQETASDSVIQASPALDCSGFSVYVSQTRLASKMTHNVGRISYVSALEPVQVHFTLLAPATGTVYWTGNYPGHVSDLLLKSDLRYFSVDERILLAFLASGRIGNTLQCYTAWQRTAWTCSQAGPKFGRTNAGDEDTILLFLLVQTILLLLLLVVVRFCCIFWRKEKLKDNGLSGFLEKRRSLHSKKKELNKLISELEDKAIEEAAANETLQDLGQIVKQKGVERKLRSSYSLGRDHTVSSGAALSIIPLYNGKMKSQSFQNSRQKESITIFNTFSESSSMEEREDSESGYSGSSSSSWETEKPEEEIMVEPSSVYTNPMYNEIEIDLEGEEGRSGLKRRTRSSAH